MEDLRALDVTASFCIGKNQQREYTPTLTDFRPKYKLTLPPSPTFVYYFFLSFTGFWCFCLSHLGKKSIHAHCPAFSAGFESWQSPLAHLNMYIICTHVWRRTRYIRPKSHHFCSCVETLVGLCQDPKAWPKPFGTSVQGPEKQSWWCQREGDQRQLKFLYRSYIYKKI